jgi:hypothetical protein
MLYSNPCQGQTTCGSFTSQVCPCAFFLLVDDADHRRRNFPSAALPFKHHAEGRHRIPERRYRVTDWACRFSDRPRYLPHANSTKRDLYPVTVLDITEPDLLIVGLYQIRPGYPVIVPPDRSTAFFRRFVSSASKPPSASICRNSERRTATRLIVPSSSTSPAFQLPSVCRMT